VIENLPAILGAVAVVIGAVSTLVLGLQARANRLDAASTRRLAQYELWRPSIVRLVSDLRTLLAKNQLDEPAGIDAVLKFPPDESVTTDD
jgi:hypothetical protein